ncbi:hypothetical protein EOA25_32345, partial [Mesorhizobium sp. M2A.F.Ca.ET.040.01.1.1]
MAEKLHPKIDNGLPKESASFSGGTLVCLCTSNPVKVKVKGQIAHDHAFRLPAFGAAAGVVV